MPASVSTAPRWPENSSRSNASDEACAATHPETECPGLPVDAVTIPESRCGPSDTPRSRIGSHKSAFPHESEESVRTALPTHRQDHRSDAVLTEAVRQTYSQRRKYS